MLAHALCLRQRLHCSDHAATAGVSSGPAGVAAAAVAAAFAAATDAAAAVAAVGPSPPPRLIGSSTLRTESWEIYGELSVAADQAPNSRGELPIHPAARRELLGELT